MFAVQDLHIFLAPEAFHQRFAATVGLEENRGGAFGEVQRFGHFRLEGWDDSELFAVFYEHSSGFRRQSGEGGDAGDDFQFHAGDGFTYDFQHITECTVGHGVAERGEGTVPARFQFRNDGVGVGLHLRGADGLVTRHAEDLEMDFSAWLEGFDYGPGNAARCVLGDDGKDYVYGAQHVRRPEGQVPRVAGADAHAVQFSRFHGKILVVG